MIKSILAGFALLLCTAAVAQTTKTDSAKKKAPPVFQFNFQPVRQVTGGVNLPGAVINDFFLYENVGEQRLSSASDVSSARATEIRINHKRVADSLMSTFTQSWNAIAAKEYKAWQDTVGKPKPAGKKPKSN